MVELGVKKAQRGKWREEQFPGFCTLSQNEILHKKRFFNLTHLNERDSKWVGAYSWMVKHLPPLILT